MTVSVSTVSYLSVLFWCSGQLTVWKYSYRIGRVEVLDPSGYWVSGPRPAAVGITELGGVAGAAEGQVWRQRDRAAERSN